MIEKKRKIRAVWKRFGGLLLALCIFWPVTGFEAGQAEWAEDTAKAATPVTGDNTAGAEYGLASPGTLTIGTSPNFAPFSCATDNGGVTGLEPAMMQAIAYKLGLEIEFKTIHKMADVEDALADGSVDIIASSYPFADLDDSRREEFALTDAYYTLDYVLAVRQGSDYRHVTDLDSKPVGCFWGFDSVLAGPDPEQVTGYGQSRKALEDLVLQKTEGVLLDRHAADRYREMFDDYLRWIEGEWESRDFCLAVQKDNARLLEALNRCIREMKEDGTLDQLIEEFVV